MLASLLALSVVATPATSVEHSLSHVPFVIIGKEDYEIPNLGPARTHLDVQKIANHLGLGWADIDGTIVLFEPPLSHLLRTEVVGECFLFPIRTLAQMGPDEVKSAFAAPQPLRDYPVHCRSNDKKLDPSATLENIGLEGIRFFTGFSLVPVQPDPSAMTDNRPTLLRPVRFVWPGSRSSSSMAIPAKELEPPSLSFTSRDLFGDQAAELSSQPIQTAEVGSRVKLTWTELAEQTDANSNTPVGWEHTGVGDSGRITQKRFFFLPEQLSQDIRPTLLSFANRTYGGIRPTTRNDRRSFRVDSLVLAAPFDPEVARYISALFPTKYSLIVTTVLDRPALANFIDDAWLSRIPPGYTHFLFQPEIIAIRYRPFYADPVIVEHFSPIHLRHFQERT